MTTQLNKAFAAKAIDTAQRMSITEPKCAAINEYLMRAGLLAWDDDRALWWVHHPIDGPQAAVWLMPVALQFEPRVA